MRRREFLVSSSALAAAFPFWARAGESFARIGFLCPAYLDRDVGFEAFRAGLRALGDVEGRNVEIDSRFWVEPEEEMELASDLVDLKVDVIVTAADGVFAAHSVTKTVPIVAAVTFDLVALGIADSLGHPGGNVTGLTFFVNEMQVKRIELLKQVKPAITRAGLLVPKGLSSAPTYPGATEESVKALGVVLEPIEVTRPSDFEHALTARTGESIGGLIVTDAPQFVVGAGAIAIAGAAARRGLPSVGAPFFARNGGLLGYGVELAPMFRRAAIFVDKILNGAKPGDVPIEQATKFETVVNLRTAQAISIDLPPAVLAAADEVIE